MQKSHEEVRKAAGPLTSAAQCDVMRPFLFFVQESDESEGFEECAGAPPNWGTTVSGDALWLGCLGCDAVSHSSDQELII